MHYNNEGRRCRAYAVRNEYVCVRHRVPDEIINVVKSDPFDLIPALAGLRNPAQIQSALAQVAQRLAARTIDDKRAGLILYALQSAVLNLANSPAARLPRILDAGPIRRRRRRAFHWQPQPATLAPPQSAVILSEGANAPESKDLRVDHTVTSCGAVLPSGPTC